jgi:hypothetical protein
MKQSFIKKKAEKPSKLGDPDPLDDLDVKKLELVARGRGWGTNPQAGKERARALTIPNKTARPASRKRRRA